MVAAISGLFRRVRFERVDIFRPFRHLQWRVRRESEKGAGLPHSTRSLASFSAWLLMHESRLSAWLVMLELALKTWTNERVKYGNMDSGWCPYFCSIFSSLKWNNLYRFNLFERCTAYIFKEDSVSSLLARSCMNGLRSTWSDVWVDLTGKFVGERERGNGYVQRWVI